jgi:hypothetical protein
MSARDQARRHAFVRSDTSWKLSVAVLVEEEGGPSRRDSMVEADRSRAPRAGMGSRWRYWPLAATQTMGWKYNGTQ